MTDMLYWRKPHMNDEPPDSIYVADSYEDPLYTMVPATFEEVKAWVKEREVPTECVHCGRPIVKDGEGLYVWIDPEATGDDSVWRESCDSHDTFEANHEPREEMTVAEAIGEGDDAPKVWSQLPPEILLDL